MSIHSTETPLNLTNEGKGNPVTKRKVWFSLLVIVLAFFFLGRIQAAAAITNAQASLLSAQQTDSAYAASQTNSGTMSLIIVAVAIVILLAIWGTNLKKWLLTILGSGFIVAIAACAPVQNAVGNPQRKAVVYPNQVTFVIQLNGNNNQVALNVTPSTPLPSTPESTSEAPVSVSGADTLPPSNPDYWKSKLKVNTSELVITTYCFQSTQLSGCENRDAVRIVTVTTTSVEVRWVANPIVEGQPIDEKDAFSMQSRETNGGSTGVYVGADIIAHIAPEDAALYLANYGYSNVIDEATQTWPARDLKTVLKGENAEVQSFLQTQLTREYGIRSAVQENNEYTQISDKVGEALVTHFKNKGITIDSFGLRDGNVYENPRVQQSFDSAFDRAKQQEEAEASAKRQEVLNQQLIDQAKAEATAELIKAEASAKAKQLQADAIKNNPSALLQQMIDKWDGHGPTTVIGGSGGVTSPMVYSLPQASAELTPTPAP